MPFSVSMQVAMDAAAASVLPAATSSRRTSGEEALAFGINPESLYQLWDNFQHEGHPDGVALADPCHDGNTWYAQFGWRAVETQYQVESWRVLGVTKQQFAAASSPFSNDGSETVVFKPSFKISTTNTFTSTNDASHTVAVSQTINYGVSFLGTGGGGSTMLSFAQTWGSSETRTSTDTWELTTGVDVPVGPGKSVSVDFMLHKCIMQVEIVYRLSLSGFAVANYGHAVNNHFIWAVDVNHLLGHSGRATSILVKETVTVEFFANSSVVVRDGRGKRIKLPVQYGVDPIPVRRQAPRRRK